MNKPNDREGFVRNAEPLPETPGPIIDIDNEPEQIEQPKEVWPVKVKLLHRGVRSGADTVHELSFREPTGGDINRYGNPCHVNQDGDVIILERKMTTMMSALSGILPPFIEAMDPRDWNSCAYRLRGFFIPDPTAW
ncbi:phage tail assembly protein [Bradyrhizobium sp. SRL28]|uniref:phage tail assembly protein n=1 Tax=Bradyrhizobium sp. SRL28 TaxID=2836178 RepID=UPI001BDF2A50|nr:phage tail assembly protein [Bradyrhizobium sp. SRL28]MBT1509407.1 phage tail assembly protein [Bradyrhizobium sp. SRL28]